MFTNDTTAIAINGLARFALVTDKALATLIIFMVMATSLFLSGLLHEKNGWEMLNYLAVVPVLAIVAGLVWLHFLRRSGVPSAKA